MNILKMNDFFEVQDRLSRSVQEIQKVLDAPKKAVLEIQDRQARLIKELSNPFQKVLDDHRRIRESLSSSLSGLSFLS